MTDTTSTTPTTGTTTTRTITDTTTGVPMRALRYTEYGGPEVLAVAEAPVPEVGPGKVLVRVEAAGLDRGTVHFVTGEPRLMRLVEGVRRPKHQIIGRDVAGVVEAVGEGVTDLAPGDEVFGTARGALAERVVADPAKLARKPAALSFAQAAAVPVSAQTALAAVRDQGHVQAGQRVLVLGASGGVGTYAVQLAKALGAHVTGVCSAAKAELVRGLGADEVLDYATTDPTDGTARYDVVIDIGGSRKVRALRRALTPTGTLVMVGGEGGGRWFGGIDRQLRAVLWSPVVRQRLRMLVFRETRESLEVLTGYLEAGTVVPAIDSVVDLDGAPDALARLDAGEIRGKVVVAVGPAAAGD